ncbi:putative uracil-DNA glycosylase [Dioscorea sansibarensis]
MSLAAKFPFKAGNEPNVEKEGKPFKPEQCISSFKDAIKLQELQGKQFPRNNYIVTHEAEDIEEQQIVDSQNSPGAHLQGDGPIGYTKDEGIFFHGSEVGASHPSPDSRIDSPFTVSPSLSSSEAGFRSSPEDAASKQKSAISSQNSSEYPAQTVDQMGTYLESNPRSEELSIENMHNFLDGYTSFTHLLKMAENTGFQKFYTSSNGRVSSEYGSVVNQLTSTVSEKGNSILDLLDNPDGACTSAVMPNNPDQACHDFMGVTSKSSTSNHEYSSTNFMSEEKATAYGVIEETTRLPFAPLNFTANYIAGRERVASVGNKADITDKLESSTSETTTLLGACTPLQKIPLHQLDGSARENCFDKQLPAEALDTALSKSILMEEPKSHGWHLTKGQQINEETSALGEISQPTAAVQTRNSVVYQPPKISPNNTEQAAHNLGAIESKSNAGVVISEKAPAETVVDGSTRKRPRADLERKKNFDWDSLRKQVCCEDIQTERSSDRMDSVDWEAVRLADVSEISETIRERGMNNMLAERIKDFLNRLVRDHGSVDLEWLRDIPPDKAKEYLLSIRGLGLKSVECVRLLTLHHLAFPVDTNVGRISVRLGWVPLQPLPESLQLHLLEMYPVLETIQRYLWPRLCRLDQRTLYELHYQLITFGKVFCTKSKPNCNACPMRGECKHFASAFASARLALPGPEEKGIVSSVTPIATENNQNIGFNPVSLPQLLEGNNLSQERTVMKNCEPIIEEPATPEPECLETSESAIEDYFDEDPDEIPVIKLNLEEFTQNLQNFMQENNLDIQEGDMSKALVALAPEAASIPMPKLKNVSRLRTEHQVYELPDSHPLLEGLDRREPDDPCSYLLAIWTPGETSQSNEPPKTCCDSQETGKLCDKITCFSCNSVREAQSQIVRATLLIPCRTAMRGSFPLNGTYFQVNEVFADHESSHNPINVPRESIWNLPRRTVYFGTSMPSIFRGLSTEGIQHCFWRGFVCVRGFDRATRAPRPLSRRLHFPASKVTRDKTNGPKKEE